MPTYVYRCDTCSNQFEIVQRFSDDPLKACPDCIGQVQRVIHPVGVVFKGSGWYINDSRPGNSSTTLDSSSEKSDSNGTSPEASKKDAGKDSKPEPAKATTDSKKSEKTAATTAAD